MSVGVIVPVYNRAELVLDALEGVASQDLAPSRLVVVDDGSTDNSVDEVRNWIDSRDLAFPVELICKPNGGVSSARNVGLESIRECSFVAFLDSDDIWPTDFLRRAVGALQEDPDAVAASADRRYENGTGEFTRFLTMQDVHRDGTNWLMLNDGGIASSSVFLRSAIEVLGGFDETLKTGEDLALFLPLSLMGTWHHLPGSPVVFRQDAGDEDTRVANLSAHFKDNHRRWARVYEDFVLRYHGHPSLPEPLCSAVLAKRWYRAGRELMRAGQVADARDCFVRSTQYRTLNKAWLRLASSYFSRAA